MAFLLLWHKITSPKNKYSPSFGWISINIFISLHTALSALWVFQNWMCYYCLAFPSLSLWVTSIALRNWICILILQCDSSALSPASQPVFLAWPWKKPLNKTFSGIVSTYLPRFTENIAFFFFKPFLWFWQTCSKVIIYSPCIPRGVQ